MSTVKKHPRSPKRSNRTATKKSNGRKWSASVTQHSNALDLEKGVFTSGSPGKIANSLERSAQRSKRRKGTARQSAMSMLNFYINRAGKKLPAAEKKVLLKAKNKLKAKSEKED